MSDREREALARRYHLARVCEHYEPSHAYRLGTSCRVCRATDYRHDLKRLLRVLALVMGA